MPGTVVEALGLEGTVLLARGPNGLVKVKAEEALAGKTVAVYFSAHWCGPCRAFTPVLAQVYQRVRAAHPEFACVFVSADQTPQQFKDYLWTMPWLALPFEDATGRARLSNQFGVRGIPRLVILGADGQIVSNDARGAVLSDRNGDNFPWRGATGPSLLQGWLSTRGLLLLFFLLYWLSQFFTAKR